MAQRSDPEKTSGKPSRFFVAGCEGNSFREFFASLRLGVFALKVFCIFPPPRRHRRPAPGGELTNES
jgi:hypothetical protein